MGNRILAFRMDVLIITLNFSQNYNITLNIFKQPALYAIIILLMTGIGEAVAQSQNKLGHTPLQARGPIPEDFRILSSEKYERDRALINRKEKRKVRKARDEFFLRSNFIIDELLLSGVVLFNDSLTNYLNAVADEVLKHDPDLRKNLQFYTVRSASVNAFATDRGSIFFNVGIFAKLENEAQLAFIICHEVIHYLEKHSMNRALVVDSLNREGLSRQDKIEETLLAKSNYSKEQESEADLKGLDLFLQSEYAHDGAFEALQLLSSSDAPGDHSWGPLAETHIEFPDITWPQSYLLDSVVTVDPERFAEWEQYSTHPSIEARLQALKTKMTGYDSTMGQAFLVSEPLFKRFQKVARLESCHIFLHNRKYIHALYLAAQLQKDQPENPYLRWIKDRAIYGLAKYAMEGKRYSIVDEPVNYHPNLQPLAHFYRKIEVRELGMLSLHHMWNESKHNNDVASYEMMKEDLAATFIKEHDYRGEYLSGDLRIPERDTAWAQMLKRTLTVWDTLKTDPKFENYYKGVQRDVKKRRRLEWADDEPETARYRSNREMVFVDPAYLKLDERKDQPVSFLASESSQQELLDYLEQSIDLLRVRARLLSPFQLTEGSIKEYREMSLLKRYISDITDQHFNMVPVDHDLMLEYIDNGGAPYVAMNGVFALRIDKRQYTTYLIAATVMMPFIAPFTMSEILLPGYEAMTLMYVHDVESNRPIGAYVHHMDKKDSKAAIKQSLYHSIQIITNK